MQRVSGRQSALFMEGYGDVSGRRGVEFSGELTAQKKLGDFLGSPSFVAPRALFVLGDGASQKLLTLYGKMTYERQ